MSEQTDRPPARTWGDDLFRDDRPVEEQLAELRTIVIVLRRQVNALKRRVWALDGEHQE